MALDRIRQAYAGQYDKEWDRLRSTPFTRTEFLITSHCLQRYLPSTGLILDAGSGPGRYAIDLLQRGYRVVLFDLVREMLQLARRKLSEAGGGEAGASFVEGDICSLGYASAVFDAVISLGAPLSHLAEAQSRLNAVREMARVLRPGGWIFVTGMSRIAYYRASVYWLNRGLLQQIREPEERMRGVFQGWINGYAFAPGELAQLLAYAGLQVIDQVGCEGLAAHLPMESLEMVENDPEFGPMWKEVLLETCNEPSIIGISNHQLIVARKPAFPARHSQE